jgi:hypothetical protein
MTLIKVFRNTGCYRLLRLWLLPAVVPYWRRRWRWHRGRRRWGRGSRVGRRGQQRRRLDGRQRQERLLPPRAGTRATLRDAEEEREYMVLRAGGATSVFVCSLANRWRGYNGHVNRYFRIGGVMRVLLEIALWLILPSRQARPWSRTGARKMN